MNIEPTQAEIIAAEHALMKDALECIAGNDSEENRNFADQIAINVLAKLEEYR